MSDARIGIVGMGLIGGSFALALKQAGYDGEIVGYDPAVSADLLKDRFVDRMSNSLSALARECDVVMIATPVGVVRTLLAEIVSSCSPQTIITDVGSTKHMFVQIACEAFKRESSRESDIEVLPLVPGHPIAGSEKSGIAAAEANLFRGRKVVLTPLENTDVHALALITCLWEKIGAEVTQMDVATHDALFAFTSHLPHMVAYALINGLLVSRHSDQAIDYVAGGLRDFTRIAKSDPVMWRDICLANRDNLIEAIAGFETALENLRGMVANADADALADFFKRTNDYCHRINKLD